MREIKFRGKTKKGKWVYGYYYFSYNEHKIMSIADDDLNGERTLSYPVIPKTVGQYTGLKDKNGVEIYEGDIDENGWIVKFDEKAYAFIGEHEDHQNGWYFLSELIDELGGFTIKNNMHDKN